MSRAGKIFTTYTKSGLRRFAVEIYHDKLNKYQVIRGDNKYVVEQKAKAKMKQWDDMWERKEAALEVRLDREKRAQDKQQKINLAAEKTTHAQNELETINSILIHTLNVDDAIDWETLKSFDDFSVAKPNDPTIPREPLREDEIYQPKLNIFDHCIISINRGKPKEAEAY